MQVMSAVLTGILRWLRAGYFLPRPGVQPGKRLAVLLLLLMAACSSILPEGGESQPLRRLPTDAEVEQYNAQVAPEERIVCRDETRVGTNIPQRTCRYIRDMEETSRTTREQLRNILH